MTSQLRRAAVSIAANVAEGAGRGADGDYRRFVQIAIGSAFECETHLTLAQDVGLIDSVEGMSLIKDIEEIKQMLHGLARSLR